jgi:hypothetical protein
MPVTRPTLLRRQQPQISMAIKQLSPLGLNEKQLSDAAAPSK